MVGNTNANSAQVPDWSNNIPLPSEVLTDNGYICPNDGLLVGYIAVPKSPSSISNLYINGVIVARVDSANTSLVASVQCPAAKGNVIRAESQFAVLHLVPWKRV